jgi:hypothetical protein
MQKLTDAQKRAVELMRQYGSVIGGARCSIWRIRAPRYLEWAISNSTMLSLSRLGLVKIDGNTATLAEGAEK